MVLLLFSRIKDFNLKILPSLIFCNFSARGVEEGVCTPSGVLREGQPVDPPPAPGRTFLLHPE